MARYRLRALVLIPVMSAAALAVSSVWGPLGSAEPPPRESTSPSPAGVDGDQDSSNSTVNNFELPVCEPFVPPITSADYGGILEPSDSAPEERACQALDEVADLPLEKQAPPLP